jgi:hypothetical protein
VSQDDKNAPNCDHERVIRPLDCWVREGIASMLSLGAMLKWRNPVGPGSVHNRPYGAPYHGPAELGAA